MKDRKGGVKRGRREENLMSEKMRERRGEREGKIRLEGREKVMGE